jgi:hypothetical protein
MTEFKYQPRSLREVMARTVQTRDEWEKPPKVELEEKCGRCGHERWAHCFVRRALKNRSVLWVCEYGTPGNRQIAWEIANGCRRGLYPVRCRHSVANQDFPLCTSPACTRRSCDCGGFVSPYKKPPKKPPAKPRKKRATKPSEQQTNLEFGNTSCPADLTMPAGLMGSVFRAGNSSRKRYDSTGVSAMRTPTLKIAAAGGAKQPIRSSLKEREKAMHIDQS